MVKGENQHKKEFKKLAVLVAILAMVLSAIPVSAKAQANPRTTLYKQVRLENMSVTLGWFQPSADNVKFSQSKKIGTVKAMSKDAYGYSVYKFTPKKAGKTVVTVKYKSDGVYVTEKNPFTVLKYTNPVATIKLGNTEIAGSKFNKIDKINLSYSKFSKQNNALTVTPKSGWTYAGATVINKKGTSLSSGDVNRIKAKGGKGNYILKLRFTNDKNGGIVYTEIVFK